MRSLRDEMSGGQPGNVGPYALLALALIAVSSAGAVLQQMEGIPPLLKASWRMYGTSLVLVPGFLYQLNAIDRASISMNDCYLILFPRSSWHFISVVGFGARPHESGT